jgi:hypothetical protein
VMVNTGSSELAYVTSALRFVFYKVEETYTLCFHSTKKCLCRSTER